MALFVAICRDIENGLALRQSVRERHLAHVRALPPGLIRLAGPFLDEAGEMCGSMFIFDAEDRAAIDAYFAKDPYVTAGLFAEIDIRPWRLTIPWS
ncbi:MAG TPA: YciI family protein [Caulobacteraceae bacterium]|nr:YciI family protein [Caulobacteraceae bacterium]